MQELQGLRAVGGVPRETTQVGGAGTNQGAGAGIIGQLDHSPALKRGGGYMMK